METKLDTLEQKLSELGKIDPFAKQEETSPDAAPAEPQDEMPLESPDSGNAQPEDRGDAQDAQDRQEDQQVPQQVPQQETRQETKQEEEQKPSEPKLSADDIVLAYLKAQNGEFGERSKQIENDAKILLEDMRLADWLSLLEKAESGSYGALSDDIKALVREYLPVVQAREIVAREEQERERQKQESELKALQAKQAESYERASAKYPDLKNEKSPFRQHVEAIIRDFIFDGTDPQNPKQGPLFGLLSTPNWPELVADLASRSFQLVLQYPYSTVKPKQVVIRGAEPSGNPSSGQQSGSKLEQLEAQLASLGKIRAV